MRLMKILMLLLSLFFYSTSVSFAEMSQEELKSKYEVFKKFYLPHHHAHFWVQYGKKRDSYLYYDQYSVNKATDQEGNRVWRVSLTSLGGIDVGNELLISTFSFNRTKDELRSYRFYSEKSTISSLQPHALWNYDLLLDRLEEAQGEFATQLDTSYLENIDVGTLNLRWGDEYWPAYKERKVGFKWDELTVGEFMRYGSADYQTNFSDVKSLDLVLGFYQDRFGSLDFRIKYRENLLMLKEKYDQRFTFLGMIPLGKGKECYFWENDQVVILAEYDKEEIEGRVYIIHKKMFVEFLKMVQMK